MSVDVSKVGWTPAARAAALAARRGGRGGGSLQPKDRVKLDKEAHMAVAATNLSDKRLEASVTRASLTSKRLVVIPDRVNRASKLSRAASSRLAKQKGVSKDQRADLKNSRSRIAKTKMGMDRIRAVRHSNAVVRRVAKSHYHRGGPGGRWGKSFSEQAFAEFEFLQRMKAGVF